MSYAEYSDLELEKELHHLYRSKFGQNLNPQLRRGLDNAMMGIINTLRERRGQDLIAMGQP